LTLPFGLPSVTGTPGLLKEADIALTRGKTIQIARELLVTAGSEGSDRHNGWISVPKVVKSTTWSDPLCD